MTVFITIVRIMGFVAGLLLVFGAIVDLIDPFWRYFTLLLGALFLIPWKRIVESLLWWPLYSLLLILALVMCTNQMQLIHTSDTSNKTVVHLIWILIIVGQPAVIWLMKSPMRLQKDMAKPPRP